MPALTALATDDRSARVLLSMIGTPGDVATGKLLTEVGAAELISIADGDGPVPGMDRVEAAVWRDRLHSAATPDHIGKRMAEASSFRVIIPSDPDWPTALNDLGHRAPYVLWAKGRTELLAEPLPQRITVTGVDRPTPRATLTSSIALRGRACCCLRCHRLWHQLASGLSTDRASSPPCRAPRSSLKQDLAQVHCTRPPRQRSWGASSAPSPGR